MSTRRSSSVIASIGEMEMVDMSRLAKSGMRRDVATRKIRKITIQVYVLRLR